MFAGVAGETFGETSGEASGETSGEVVRSPGVVAGVVGEVAGEASGEVSGEVVRSPGEAVSGVVGSGASSQNLDRTEKLFMKLHGTETQRQRLCGTEATSLSHRDDVSVAQKDTASVYT